MPYFNYHAKIKKLLRENKLIFYEIVDDYHGIKPALVLYFSSGEVYPIREHKFSEYLQILSELN